MACRPVPAGIEGEQVAAVGCGATLKAIHANGLLDLGWRRQLSLERLGTVLLAFGYGASIISAFEKTRARSLLAWEASFPRSKREAG
jgi:hypothetical protein